MNDLAQDFERRAEEQLKAAIGIYESVDFNTNPKKQATFVVGKTTANLFSMLAELAAYLQATDEMTIRRKEIMEQNNAIRIAAAEWDEFDRLVAGFSGGDGSGGAGA
ncbi:hypothetical protein LCGC14_1042830 [marine sediment metagenome]|uniref:Uncharacterized protein n=1 Tax=marine sediment metagenome TaxID=412755 RepID=A0A0F9MR68_9ZZZZ